MRDAGGYPEKEIGKTLMFKAFAPGGPLAKASDDELERLVGVTLHVIEEEAKG